MFYRLFCVVVVVFWLVMTVMLVMRSYFMTEDRLPLVDNTNEVIERFLENPNTTNLNVYRDEKNVGSITIVSHEQTDGGTQLLITALGKINFPGLEEQDVAWRGELGLTPDEEVSKFNLDVKFRNPYLTVGLEVDPETFEISYRVEQGGKVLVDSDDEKSKAVKRVKFLLGLWGVSPEALRKKRDRGESIAKDNALVARFGKVVIGGERQTAYVVELAPTLGPKFKIYFSEAGEILKVGPVLSYQILSEGFVVGRDEEGTDQ